MADSVHCQLLVTCTGWVRWFVGAFVSSQINGIEVLYSHSSDPNATINASVSLLDDIHGWISAVVVAVWFILLYVAPVWIGIELLFARASGRRDALATVFKSKESDSNAFPAYATREAWLTHLSSPLYPLMFIFTSTMALLLLYLGLTSGIEWVFSSLTDFVRQMPVVTR